MIMGVLGESVFVLLCISFLLPQQINGNFRSERASCPSAAFSRCECGTNQCDGEPCDCGFSMCECDINHCDGEPCDCGIPMCECGMDNCDEPCHCEPITWTPPSGWMGPTPTLYYSFDTLDGLTLMAGTQKSNFAALVSGKKNRSLRTDATQQQWVDLGIHTDVCVTRPDTCGASGGAISMWLRADADRHWRGIMTSRNRSLSSDTSFHVGVTDRDITFDFHVLDGAFHKSVRRSCDDWLHVVINFIGADEGAEAYVNGGGHHIRTSYKLPQNNTEGIGRIVIGRFSVEDNRSYASLEMDELLFFNETLTAEEATSLYNI